MAGLYPYNTCLSFITSRAATSEAIHAGSQFITLHKMGSMRAEEVKKGFVDLKETKRLIADTFKQTGLICESYTGEVTVGITDGGVTFIRKSETLK